MENLKLTGKKTHSTDDQMRGLSAVLVDANDVFIDNGAMHAKSKVEQGITFVKDREEVEAGREVWCFWLTLLRREGGVQGYKAIQGFPMYIDATAKKGFKVLSESVNKMDKVVKGQIDLSGVPEDVQQKLRRFLEAREVLWNEAEPSFRDAFRA